jgi:hypothetical protein
MPVVFSRNGSGRIYADFGRNGSHTEARANSVVFGRNGSHRISMVFGRNGNLIEAFRRNGSHRIYAAFGRNGSHLFVGKGPISEACCDCRSCSGHLFIVAGNLKLFHRPILGWARFYADKQSNVFADKCDSFDVIYSTFIHNKNRCRKT